MPPAPVTTLMLGVPARTVTVALTFSPEAPGDPAVGVFVKPPLPPPPPATSVTFRVRTPDGTEKVCTTPYGDENLTLLAVDRDAAEAKELVPPATPNVVAEMHATQAPTVVKRFRRFIVRLTVVFESPVATRPTGGKLAACLRRRPPPLTRRERTIDGPSRRRGMRTASVPGPAGASRTRAPRSGSADLDERPVGDRGVGPGHPGSSGLGRGLGRDSPPTRERGRPLP